MQFDHSKLSARIVEKFGTRRRFAEVAGIPEATLSRKLGGKSNISDEDMCLWSSAELLDIPTELIGDFFCALKFHF